MKQVTTLLCLVIFFVSADAQISIKVKKTVSGNEVDVKTSGRPNTSNSAGTKTIPSDNQSPTPAETKTAPVTETPKTVIDTAAKPSGNSSFDASYNGPAKVQLKSFWRYMDKLRAGDMNALGNAVRMLDQAKQADPSYNLSGIEAELKAYVDKDKQSSAIAEAGANKKEEDERFVRDTWMTLIDIYDKREGTPIGASDGRGYYEKAKSLDIPRFYIIRDAAGANASKNITMVDEILKDYNAYLDRSKLIDMVYQYLNASKTGTPEDRKENLEQARLFCLGVLILVPDRQDFKQKLNDIAKQTGNVNADVAKYFTSEFHKEHLNKIVFSTKPLVIGKEKDMGAVIKNDFKAGESVFGTVYLGRTVKEAQDGKPMLKINFTVEHGREVRGGETYLLVPDAVQQQSYFQFALIPDEQWLKNNYKQYIDDNNWTIILMTEALAEDNSDPVQKVTVELDFWKPGAENMKAAMSYDISDGATALKNLAKKLRADHLASVQLPKAGMSNPSLEQQMLAVANGLGWKDKYTKTIIRSSEWHISKNELTGAIIYRGLSAVCITKDDEGRCYYQEFSFTQDYVGGGNYSSKLKFGGYGGKKELTCDKVK